MLSKKIKPEKATSQELCVATWQIKSKLVNVSVKDGNRKKCPVLHLFIMVEGCIPQLTVKIKAESSGGHSMKGFTVDDPLHTRLSWQLWKLSRANYQAP